ncbi:Mfa2p [Saccharomyces cerevisiae YJM1478]|uniref:Mating hormone A-factor 2 n=7 Tax=Saccharomyces cerevisiae TaxID=4932 RepID=MFA2_YEAST|nr:mating pheromone a [Saccharomyces cerevisiae S288C]P34166.1 RecName: Full=Mating hormone A-factor 2; Flags: Precursor [Saccharomyces cerevisiae S288C]AAA67688.1 a-factor precursor [Saccharomyces cerevisiae]AHY76953.1 Mfa2p [Saccharomyces cerevisiae YJM993]AJP41191.1 Mfa2p [Saccharomyces cerevisiae YJM1078]AJT01628.1 Mfa2p [Saccharomyces cerevisiae YJM189]AJT01997.1 Mfa2p [Saccharomyces cerevisiae YJM193]AJT02372.1 Mfa2p [Saccharomyces cerevisiae YJM195]AJT02741.1 Mfa2p [Saccharomyces cer|eukprot:NP_014254.1 mating pheromone a [Saccharomyces cerevisiae S288C]
MQPITTASTQATQKDKSSEKKDNYIIKGLFWDPACVIA